MSKRRPKGKKQQPADKNPPTPLSEPEKGQSPAEVAPGSNDKEDSRKSVRPRGTWADWCSVIVQAGALLALLFYTFYTKHQWDTLKA